MNKNKFLNLFENLKEEPKLNLHYNSRVLLVDGMNTFIRSFSAVNKLNIYGNHIGGISGFLMSLGHALKVVNPTRVIIAFDGENGTRNRKYLYPEYKATRNTGKVMNYKTFMSKELEDEAQVEQIGRLIDYLSCLPVTCTCSYSLEADDIIGYLSKKVVTEYDDSEVYIMSSDKDFYQSITDRIKVYSPIKKKIYGINEVLEEHGVHPENFLIYKTLLGDTSDNIDGVLGVGEKTILKILPEIKEEKRLYLDEIMDISRDRIDGSKLYSKILEAQKRLEINYKIMNIREPNISNSDIEDLNRQFYRKVKPLRKFDFIKIYRNDGMGDAIISVETWVNVFSILNNY